MTPFDYYIAEGAVRGLLLDSNLLLLYAVGLFDPTLVEKYKRTRQYTRDDFDLLRQIIARFPCVVTSPHILAEVSNLAIERERPESRRVAVLLDLFRSSKELFIAKDEILQTDAVRTLGITDAAIVELARRQHLLVLTDDFALNGYIGDAGCYSMNLNHLRSQHWFT